MAIRNIVSSRIVGLWLAASTIAGVALTSTGTALAWKPVTHVLLAQKAWEEAQNGKVTIYATDFSNDDFPCPQIITLRGVKVDPCRTSTGQPRRQIIGTYTVDPTLLAAIRGHPENFYAGVLGPDAYPDILTGQERIHPPASPSGPDNDAGGSGTDPWLAQLWAAAWRSGDPQKIAWAAGFLAHAAGDIYAHSFINTFTGGIFNLGENALKHITLEGYVSERTPPLPSSVFSSVEFEGISGLEDFIAQNTIDTPAGQPSERNKALSVPYLLQDLRAGLENVRASYDRTDARLHQDAAEAWYLASPSGAGAELAWACGKGACPNPSHSNDTCPTDRFPKGTAVCMGLYVGGIAAWSAAEAIYAAALDVAWAAFEAGVGGVVKLTIDPRLDAVNLAFPDWVAGSHSLGTSLFFTPDGRVASDGVRGSYAKFKKDFVSIVTGLPVPTVDALAELGDFFTRPFQGLQQAYDNLKNDLVGWLLKYSTGMTLADLQDRLEQPHRRLNDTFSDNPQLGLPALNLPIANALMRVKPSCPPGNPDGACDIGSAQVAYFNVDPPGAGANLDGSKRVFAAAYNTVTLIKLLLLDTGELNRFLRDLRQQRTDVALGDVGPGGAANNVMLGFAETIDGSDQWGLHGVAATAATPQMIVARDCLAYRRVFLDQRPDVGAQLQPLGPADRPAPRTLGPQLVFWEPPSPDAAPCAAPAPSVLPFTLRPDNASVGLDGTVEFMVSSLAVFRAEQGSVTLGSSGAPPLGLPLPWNGPPLPTKPGIIVPTVVTYHAPHFSRTLTDVLTATTPDGRVAHARIWLRSRFEFHPHLVSTPAPGVGPVPLGDVGLLRPEESIELVGSSPASSLTAVSWRVVNGPGTLGDAALEAPRTAVLAGHAAQLSGLDQKLATQVTTLGSPACSGACRVQATSAARQVLSERETYARSKAQAVREAASTLAALRSTYHAPASVTQEQTVTLVGKASDGREATVALRLFPPAPPLRTKAARHVVRPGGSVDLEVDEPGVVMTWSLAPGQVGAMGAKASPEQSRLEGQAKAFLASMKTYDEKLAKARAEGDVKTVRNERMAYLLDQLKTAGPAMARLQQLEATYHAPETGKFPATATVQGKAQDGRTITVPIEILAGGENKENAR